MDAKTGRRQGGAADDMSWKSATAQLVRTEVDKRLLSLGRTTNYALAARGARVIGDRTSKTYSGSFLWLFGNVGKPPAIALTEGAELGKCWCFSGGTGMLAVRLSEAVHPTHVGIEHVSHDKAVNMTSAPRDCEVWCFGSGPTRQIAAFRYEITKAPMQIFPVSSGDVCESIELRIVTNHGRRITCLYSFSVFSVPDE